jgi:hypothetical protein
MADAVVAAARRNPGLLVIDTLPFGSGSSGSRFKVPIKIRNPGITETRAALESLTSSKVLLDAIG